MALPSTKYIGAGTPNIDVTGGVLAGPLGTPAPTTAGAVIDPAIKPLGYVSEDGLEAQGERSVEAIKDWNADIIAELQTEHSVRFALTLYGVWDKDVLVEMFGPENVTVAPDGEITVTETGAVLPNRVWIFDMKTGDKTLRIVLPNAKVSEVTENSFVAGSLAGFQAVVTAFKDDAGVKAYRYYVDGSAPSVPVVESFDPEPASVAGGEAVEVSGSGFSGATDVTVDSVAVAFNVISDSKLVLVSPALAAGDYPVVVTNGTGPSAAGTLPFS